MFNLNKEVAMTEKTKLPTGARVSMFFEGLMLAVFTRDNRCQVGIYSNADDHLFSVGIYDERFIPGGPRDCKTFTGADLKKLAPLWLYVDMGKGCQKDIFSASRFAMNDPNDPRSFSRVLDFDGPDMYGHKCKTVLIPDALSILNIPQGLFYAAQLDDFLRTVDSKHFPAPAIENECNEKVPMLKKGGLVGAHIGLSEKDGLQLKLEASSGEELISVKLEAGVQYIVNVEHVPKPSKTPLPHHPESHFYRFYEAIRPECEIHYDITGLEKDGEAQMDTFCPPMGNQYCTSATASSHFSLENPE
jgi:hypothetical protein